MNTTNGKYSKNSWRGKKLNKLYIILCLRKKIEIEIEFLYKNNYNLINVSLFV